MSNSASDADPSGHAAVRAATVQALQTMVEAVSQQVAAQTASSTANTSASNAAAGAVAPDRTELPSVPTKTSYSAEKAEQGAGDREAAEELEKAKAQVAEMQRQNTDMQKAMEEKMAQMQRQNTDLQKDLDKAKKIAVHEASERQRAEHEKSAAEDKQANDGSKPRPTTACCTVS